MITASEAAKGQLGTEVFISYSRKDGDFARQLNLALQDAGKTTWFDQESISSGVKLAKQGKIDAALAKFQAALKFKPNLKIVFYQWNKLCQQGIAYGQAAQVIAACNQAVALEPSSS